MAINFNSYFKRRYRFIGTYLIAGLSIRIMTRHSIAYRAIQRMHFAEDIAKRRQADITVIVTVVPKLSGIPLEIPQETDWQPKLFGDFKGPQYYRNTKNIKYIRFLADRNEIAPMLGIYYQEKILLFIEAKNYTYRNSIRTILLQFLGYRHIFTLHAAYLTKDGVNILFPGNSGCGKTTISINLIKSGFICCGDDISFLCRSNAKVKVYPSPMRILRIAGKIKREIAIKNKYAYCKKSSPPNFIIFPKIVHKKESELAPILPNEAMLELIENLMFSFNPVRDNYVEVIGILRQLTRQCQSYLLLSGKDIKTSSDKLLLLLRELSNKI